jgi:hypothetical protein
MMTTRITATIPITSSSSSSSSSVTSTLSSTSSFLNTAIAPTVTFTTLNIIPQINATTKNSSTKLADTTLASSTETPSTLPFTTVNLSESIQNQTDIYSTVETVGMGLAAALGAAGVLAIVANVVSTAVSTVASTTTAVASTATAAASSTSTVTSAVTSSALSAGKVITTVATSTGTAVGNTATTTGATATTGVEAGVSGLSALKDQSSAIDSVKGTLESTEELAESAKSKHSRAAGDFAKTSQSLATSHNRWTLRPQLDLSKTRFLEIELPRPLVESTTGEVLDDMIQRFLAKVGCLGIGKFSFSVEGKAESENREFVLAGKRAQLANTEYPVKIRVVDGYEVKVLLPYQLLIALLGDKSSNPSKTSESPNPTISPTITPDQSPKNLISTQTKKSRKTVTKKVKQKSNSKPVAESTPTPTSAPKSIAIRKVAPSSLVDSIKADNKLRIAEINNRRQAYREAVRKKQGNKNQVLPISSSETQKKPRYVFRNPRTGKQQFLTLTRKV